MDKKVLLIGENASSFIMKSLSDALVNNGYEVDFSPLKVTKLNAIDNKPDIIILYSGECMKENSQTMTYLKDYCIENEKKICVIGYNTEIAEVKEMFPPTLIHFEFERPLNIKLLIEKINDDLESRAMEEQKKHILVVDDSGTMLRTIKGWLGGKYKVSMASSSAMAISFLATNKPDLILLDYAMPICSGPQFMEMIKAEVTTSDIPVIFLTAKGDKESVQKVLSLKPAGYLLKTMKPEEIIDSIDQFFEKRKHLSLEG